MKCDVNFLLHILGSNCTSWSVDLQSAHVDQMSNSLLSTLIQSAVSVGQSAVNIGSERRYALSPPPPHSPRQPDTSPPHSSHLSSSTRVQYGLGEKMGDSSAYSGTQQQTPSYLTDSRQITLPSPLRLVSSCLLDLYHQCVDSGGLVRVLYDLHGGMEKRCSSTNSHLLQLRLPLLNLHQPSLDVWPAVGDMQARGGMHVTEGGGRHGLRGGVSTACSLAPSPQLLRKTIKSGS
jgi:hypothetical protein